MNNKVYDETTTNKDELIVSKCSILKRIYPHAHGNKHIKTNAISGKTFYINLMSRQFTILLLASSSNDDQ